MHTHAWCSKLMKEVAPTSSQDYFLQSVTNLAIGRQVDSRDHLKVAQQYFQLLLGASASEWDTITSRQCMASCICVLRQFDDVLIYHSLMRAYFLNGATF